jgi:DNA-binding IclR family transcriptional regulator
MKQDKVPIKAVERSFAVVEGLKKLDGAGVTELAQYIDIPKSTAYVHISTLTEMGYLIKTDGKYHISLQFLEVGEHARRQKKVYEAARPHLKKLSEETGELTNLLVEENGVGVHILKTRGDNAVELDTFPGKHIPIHQTSRGKAYLSCLPKERVQEIIDCHGMSQATGRTITDIETLFEELTEIQERGYAIDRGERVKGLHCIAAPIKDRSDVPVAAISVAGSMGKLTNERIETELSNKVLNTANVIELDLAFS